MAFNGSKFHRINHLIDAFFEVHDEGASVAQMMNPDYWPGAPAHGPNARPPMVEPGQLGLLRPADGHDYLVRVHDLTADGRPILRFVRTSQPTKVAVEAPEAVRPTTPTPPRKAA